MSHVRRNPLAFLLRHFLKTLAVVLLLTGAVTALGVYGFRNHHLNAAREALHKEEYAGARSHVRAALRVWSADADTQLLAAKIERLNGDYFEAKKHLDECKRLHGSPTDDTQVEWLMLRAESNELDEVAPGLLYAVEQNHPRKLEMLEALARAAMHDMLFQRAEDYLDRWLEIEPDNARALDWRSWVFQHLNNRDKSITDAVRGLELQPTRYKLRLRLIDLLLERKNTRAAAPHAELLVATRPDDADALTALARCRLLQLRTQEGEELLERALALKPDNATALLELARVYNRVGRPADAERLARQGLENTPDDGELLYVLCESFRLQGKDDAETERWQTRYDRQKEDVELADTFLSTHAEHPNRTAEQAAAAGAALLRLGQVRLGLYWLKEARKQDPFNRTANLALANYYEKKGDPAAAQEYRGAARGGHPALGAAAGCAVVAAP